MLDTEAVAHYELQSDSLLAKTPALLKAGWYAERDNKQWEDVRLELEQRLYALRNWRISWWAHWGKIAEAVLPRRFHWLIVPNTFSRGLAINGAIKDPTGTQAVRVCTAGMRSGLMSSSRPWFNIKPGLKNFKPDRAGELWFEMVEDRIYRVFAGSNYYQSATQMFEDLVVFGTAPKLMYEDRLDIIRCYNPCCGEYYLGTGSDFRVNSFYRTFVLTTMQCVEMFGLENCGPEIQQLWENKGAGLEAEQIVAHAIEPNFPVAMPGQKPNLGVVPGNFTYREYYWLWGRYTPNPLSVRGFRTKPFIAPRWSTTSNDAYGRSPGMDALPDILQLQLMTVRQAEAIDKIVRPPMLATVALKNQPSSINPGKVTYVPNLNEGMKSIYDIKMDLSHMTALIEKIEGRVEKWFFNDLFQMMEHLEGVQPRNEMEIAERRGEKLQVLGPIVEGIENELAEDIRHVIAIMGRRGLLPPKPQSLLGIPLEIEFDSMIAVAQRAAETATMERGLQVVTQLQAAYPDKRPADNVDLDETVRIYLEKTNFPVRAMVDKDDVAKIRQAVAKANAEAAQKAQTMQALTHAAPAVAKAAKDASELDVGGALNALQIASGQGGSSQIAPGVPQ
jgi:hypothetical protein